MRAIRRIVSGSIFIAFDIRTAKVARSFLSHLVPTFYCNFRFLSVRTRDLVFAQSSSPFSFRNCMYKKTVYLVINVWASEELSNVCIMPSVANS